MSDIVVYKEQADALLKSGFLPVAIKTPEQALAIIIKGREVGLPAMQAFAQINVIGGKPTISAEGMNYLIRKHHPRARISILKRTDSVCEIKAQRHSDESPVVFSFTMEDAKRAELLANPSWKKYPKAMLFARAFSEMARTLFPDAIGGLSYTPEEMGADIICTEEATNA